MVAALLLLYRMGEVHGDPRLPNLLRVEERRLVWIDLRESEAAESPSHAYELDVQKCAASFFACPLRMYVWWSARKATQRSFCRRLPLMRLPGACGRLWSPARHEHPQPSGKIQYGQRNDPPSALSSRGLFSHRKRLSHSPSCITNARRFVRPLFGCTARLSTYRSTMH